MENFKTGSLDGVTVLNFTWALAGPHATKTMADMGANVIYHEPAVDRMKK
jgi:crotonobetainyl-CoA:carnitine CoA-transferase CaiB-like acyl-CoA transferase